MTSRQLVSVVDDDESLRSSVRNLLRSIGLEVHTFTSAESFLRFNDLAETSCLVLDLRLDGMNGLELMSTLTSIGQQIPIVMVTADGDDESRRRAFQLGAVAYLTKPFPADDLINAVNAVLCH